MQQLSDGELVAGALQGDREAYCELVARYQGHVYGLAYSLTDDWAQAQDLAQETFLRAYCHLDELREPERFAAWLRRVAFGVTMNWLKAYRPGYLAELGAIPDLDDLDLPDFTPGPPEVLEKRDLANAVLAAIASLPPKYRVPLTMFHLDGLSYQKVAAFLDIPLGTAKSLIHRARQKLRPALAAYAGEEMIAMVSETLGSHKLPEEFAHKVIEGVTGWSTGAKESSVHAAQEAVMQAAGEDLTYDYLLGVSGLAFRMQVFQDGLCPSSPHPACGFECVARAVQALPRQVTIFGVNQQDAERVKEVREAIVRSIEAGVPVQYGSEEDGIIVGYQQDGEEWICLHPYREGGSKTFVETAWPWGLTVFGEGKQDQPSRRELAVGALQQAVTMAHAGEAGGYFVGFQAWDNYLEKVQALETVDHGNAWIYECLAQYRGSAARYLQEIAGEFSPAAAAHLREAAQLYDQMANHVLRDEEHSAGSIAPYPWALEEARTWAPLRDEEVRRLQAAYALERRAVREIEGALAETGAAT